MRTRAEHLAWCKTRAMGYVTSGDLDEALASMYSDLGKHEETAGHVGISLGVGLTAMGKLRNAPEMREFIEGFN